MRRLVVLALVLLACDATGIDDIPDRRGEPDLSYVTEAFRERGGAALISLTVTPTGPVVEDLEGIGLERVEPVPAEPMVTAWLPGDLVDAVAARPYIVAIAPEPGPEPVLEQHTNMGEYILRTELSAGTVLPGGELTLRARIENRSGDDLVLWFNSSCYLRPSARHVYRYSEPDTILIPQLAYGCQDQIRADTIPADSTRRLDRAFRADESAAPLLPGSYAMDVRWDMLDGPTHELRFRVGAP